MLTWAIGNWHNDSWNDFDCCYDIEYKNIVSESVVERICKGFRSFYAYVDHKLELELWAMPVKLVRAELGRMALSRQLHKIYSNLEFKSKVHIFDISDHYSRGP